MTRKTSESSPNDGFSLISGALIGSQVPNSGNCRGHGAPPWGWNRHLHISSCCFWRAEKVPFFFGETCFCWCFVMFWRVFAYGCHRYVFFLLELTSLYPSVVFSPIYSPPPTSSGQQVSSLAAGVPRSRKTSVHSLLRSLRPRSGKREIQTTSTEVSDDKKTSVHSLLRSFENINVRIFFKDKW